MKRLPTGFTLIELLIVVAIIGILAAIAVPNFLNAQLRAKIAKSESEIRGVSVALESYHLDNNLYPLTNFPNGEWKYPISTRMFPLTTPIAYMSSVPQDPFLYGPPGVRINDEQLWAYDTYDYVESWTLVNYKGRELLRPSLRCAEWKVTSAGPDATNAYAAAPCCSPTRAGVMTGRYPARLNLTTIIEGFRGDRAPSDSPILPARTAPHLPHEETTIAEILRSAGYTTGIIGKWHLGKGEHGPRQHGFDVAVGAPHAGMPRSYFWPQWKGNPAIEGRSEGEYLTDRLTDEACEFIESHHKRPFFLYLSYHSVHVPIEGKPDKVEKYEAKLRENPPKHGMHGNPHYAAMVESVDDGVGRVMRTLKRLAIDERTVVIFFSDNGGLCHPSHVGKHTPATTNAPLRSGKGFLYEGGIREPLIFKYPGAVKPGAVCDEPIISTDFLPTICELANIDETLWKNDTQIDGMSLKPLLADSEGKLRREALYWHYPHFSSMGGRPSGAIRVGDFKLIKHFESGKLELYNLREDIGESVNLVGRMPEKAIALHQMLVRWQRSIGANDQFRANPAFHEGTAESTAKTDLKKDE